MPELARASARQPVAGGVRPGFASAGRRRCSSAGGRKRSGLFPAKPARRDSRHRGRRRLQSDRARRRRAGRGDPAWPRLQRDQGRRRTIASPPARRCSTSVVARAAQAAGIAGLAFFSGIPGSIGGALRMNGGAYGGETKDVLIEARGVDRKGNVRSLQQCRDGIFLSPLRRARRRHLHRGGVPGPRRQSGRNRRRDGRDQEQAREDAAAQSHRRLHLQESARHERLETGGRGRLPRAHRRGRAGLRRCTAIS